MTYLVKIYSGGSRVSEKKAIELNKKKLAKYIEELGYHDISVKSGDVEGKTLVLKWSGESDDGTMNGEILVSGGSIDEMKKAVANAEGRSRSGDKLNLRQAMEIRENQYRSKDGQYDYEPEEVDQRIYELQNSTSEKELKKQLKELDSYWENDMAHANIEISQEDHSQMEELFNRHYDPAHEEAFKSRAIKTLMYSLGIKDASDIKYDDIKQYIDGFVESKVADYSMAQLDRVEIEDVPREAVATLVTCAVTYSPKALFEAIKKINSELPKEKLLATITKILNNVGSRVTVKEINDTIKENWESLATVEALTAFTAEKFGGEVEEKTATASAVSGDGLVYEVEWTVTDNAVAYTISAEGEKVACKTFPITASFARIQDKIAAQIKKCDSLRATAASEEFMDDMKAFIKYEEADFYNKVEELGLSNVTEIMDALSSHTFIKLLSLRHDGYLNKVYQDIAREMRIEDRVPAREPEVMPESIVESASIDEMKKELIESYSPAAESADGRTEENNEYADQVSKLSPAALKAHYDFVFNEGEVDPFYEEFSMIDFDGMSEGQVAKAGPGAGVTVIFRSFDTEFKIVDGAAKFEPVLVDVQFDSAYDSRRANEGMSVKFDDVTNPEDVEILLNAYGRTTNGKVHGYVRISQGEVHDENGRKLVLSPGWSRSQMKAGDSFRFVEQDTYLAGTATLTESGQYAWEDLDSIDEDEDMAESGYGDVDGDEPDAKDFDRLEGIKEKAKGDPEKAKKLASNVAKTIKEPNKAIRRAKAAKKVFGGQLGDEIYEIFMDAANHAPNKAAASSDGLECKLRHYGRDYDCLLFKTDKEANDFMEKNPEYGVIKVEENKGVYLAKNSDEGTAEASGMKRFAEDRAEEFQKEIEGKELDYKQAYELAEKYEEKYKINGLASYLMSDWYENQKSSATADFLENKYSNEHEEFGIEEFEKDAGPIPALKKYKTAYYSIVHFNKDDKQFEVLVYNKEADYKAEQPLVIKLDDMLSAVAALEDGYGLQWQEWDKPAKQKFFKTEEARQKFADELESKDSFKEFLAWSDPQSTESATTTTFENAKRSIMKALELNKWKIEPNLKVPHATHPDGTVRVWFKPQSIYYQRNPSGKFDLNSAHSMHTDPRELHNIHPDAVQEEIMRWAAEASVVASFDIKAELTRIVDSEIQMTEESDYQYGGKPERLQKMKEVKNKIQETDFDSSSQISKLKKELSIFSDTSPREQIFLAFKKFDNEE